jgi:predicted Zn-dependent protease
MRRGLANFILLVLITGSLSAQISTDKEIALGKGLAAEIQSHGRMLTDTDVAAYVNRILKTVSRDLGLLFNLTLVDSSQPIASALPGGFLVLSSAAILRADSEAELVGLLSHAIATCSGSTIEDPE